MNDYKNKSVELQRIEGLSGERTKCEVYSRIVGYLRPVAQWNEGKKAEFGDRKTYDKVRSCCEA